MPSGYMCIKKYFHTKKILGFIKAIGVLSPPNWQIWVSHPYLERSLIKVTIGWESTRLLTIPKFYSFSITIAMFYALDSWQISEWLELKEWKLIRNILSNPNGYIRPLISQPLYQLVWPHFQRTLSQISSDLPLVPKPI